MRIFPLFLALSLLPLTAPAKTELVREGGGWKLLRDGKPYFIKGGDGDTKLEVLAAAGGEFDPAFERAMRGCLGPECFGECRPPGAFPQVVGRRSRVDTHRKTGKIQA